MRRKWLDAMPEGADAKTCKAAQGYEFCNRLFELERQFEKLPAEERLIQRKEKSGPVLETYWTWLDTIPRPTGKLKDAVTYKRCDACCPNMVQRTFFAIGLRNKKRSISW